MSLTKRKPIRSAAIRKSADGEVCTWPGCDRRDGTVILAHSNMSLHGKARGIKSDDIFAAYLCAAHHFIYDADRTMSRDEKEQNFMRAMSVTQRRIWERGLMMIKGCEP